MTTSIKLISPVDGRVYAERSYADANRIEQALTAAVNAQAEWKRRPVSERAAVCSAVVDAMLAMQADIVPELAWQMGRPVRYGAGELRGFEERARYMIAIAPQALAPLAPEPIAGFRRLIKREPVGTVLVVAPWNYPYLTAVNTIIPALMAGNSVILKHARKPCWSASALPRRCAGPTCPRGCSTTCCSIIGRPPRSFRQGVYSK
ncbi:Benzaldehyde dehydrogenase [NAD(+)] [compost metagenome]